jgi:mannose-6-phosphate isomerase-like protein (cupin superfamily)
MGTEDMHPGDEFPLHKHLAQDELPYIEKGNVHARVGDQERDLHAGGKVFIPANTWVDIKNAGRRQSEWCSYFQRQDLRITCAAIRCYQTKK